MELTINLESVIENMTNSIIINDEFNPNIIKVWKEDIRFVNIDGIEENDTIYDLKDNNDLKTCIDNGLTAFDIAYLVNKRRENKDNSELFIYNNTIHVYNLKLLSKIDIIKSISSQIEKIVYNTLKYPYIDMYGLLYKEFVMPNIEKHFIKKYPENT